MECGYDRNLKALDLHHRDPTKKDPSYRNMWTWSQERFEKELASCDLLCACCHRLKHIHPDSVEFIFEL